jgi:hypothetical protein
MWDEWWNEDLTDSDIIPWVNTSSDESWMDYDLPQADYSNEGRNYPTPESTQGIGGSPVNATTELGLGSGLNLASLLKGGGKALLDYVKANPGKVGLMGVLAALGALAKASPSGGGVGKRYVGPSQPLTRTITQGKYGPIAQYAAQGGIMHAYAHGGQVKPFPMQDGGFVMTEKAMEGAEKMVPGGIYALLPETKPIVGPGTGKSDSIPAYIQGRNTVTPARVSNGEGYVPPGRSTKQLYALMKSLERSA